MTDATVTTDIHQTLDVQLNLGTEVTLYLIFSTDDLTDSCSLIIRPILNLYILINVSLLQDFHRTTTTYSIYIGQRDFTSFVLRQINTNNSYCHTIIFLINNDNLTLTLFKLGVLFVNYIQPPFAANNLALRSALL